MMCVCVCVCKFKIGVLLIVPTVASIICVYESALLMEAAGSLKCHCNFMRQLPS